MNKCPSLNCNTNTDAIPHSNAFKVLGGDDKDDFEFVAPVQFQEVVKVKSVLNEHL